MFPLHLAALNAHSECCRKLLSSGNTQLSRLEFPIAVEVNDVMGLISASRCPAWASLWSLHVFCLPEGVFSVFRCLKKH